MSILSLSIGQYSDKGRKDSNQDFHGVLIPDEPLLSMKGISAVIADGISSSDVSRIASESAVKSFLTDYYCTSETWSVKTSARRVIAATNSWLHAQTRRGLHPYDSDKGYVCTFSAIVFKSTTAHLFHIGDCRIYRIAGAALEQLTEDHRVVLSSVESYLGRALGVNPQIEIDYRAVPLTPGDVFVLATDGIYECVPPRMIVEMIAANKGDLDAAARIIGQTALDRGSDDNLTIQIIRVDRLPEPQADELLHVSDLPLPPLLQARAEFDGYRIIREIHASARSHIYLATDMTTDRLVALKTPSIDLGENPAYRRRFAMEGWIARRIDSPYVLKPEAQTRPRNYLYVVMEFVEGKSLSQWMIDNPRPDLETVRKIVEQIAKGLGAFHQKEMLHQDLRPDNIMIDATGTVRIIDFGSTRVAGVAETMPELDGEILGTVQYTAPEYFLGAAGSPQSDLYSLGVIAYQMLTGHLPFGPAAGRARTRALQRKLRYRSAVNQERGIPLWVDGALRKAVQSDPAARYDALSAFVFDLRHPNPAFREASATPLLERNPVLLWQSVSVLLAIAVVTLLAMLHATR
ncbi:bifunctional protein-serine/threonine kinase/phosphatase [[Pseudomonas] carboxydohydrogena]|uniref:Bifunctional protein-serine/threonine kinase/phosphatase n=1 Tax=Afipia carboxydohydrogena TaxID=290 RepID=A0ABY8BMH7_AFICR|nr:bifunctional protein-serine/threonine kinase/phosphatase [[Pseudomonas] carboxydohydrogena]WEF50181.1 bifunctional protein-serine/threonine kinase/phosphatase [[Pseudomonas] carboxydohydrogena]